MILKGRSWLIFFIHQNICGLTAWNSLTVCVIKYKLYSQNANLTGKVIAQLHWSGPQVGFAKLLPFFKDKFSYEQRSMNSTFCRICESVRHGNGIVLTQWDQQYTYQGSSCCYLSYPIYTAYSSLSQLQQDLFITNICTHMWNTFSSRISQHPFVTTLSSTLNHPKELLVLRPVHPGISLSFPVFTLRQYSESGTDTENVNQLNCPFSFPISHYTSSVETGTNTDKILSQSPADIAQFCCQTPRTSSGKIMSKTRWENFQSGTDTQNAW